MVEATATEIFQTLVRAFPVCTSSDEFYYFPQLPPNPHWCQWDDFSPSTIQDLTHKISQWKEELTRQKKEADSLDLAIDISILHRLISTLQEELTQVRLHESQPTHYLTIASIGLGQTLDEDLDLWHQRVKNLPPFLDEARANLKRVPTLFRDLGLEMLKETRTWIASLQSLRPGLAPVLEALDRLGEHLKRIPTTKEFRLNGEFLEAIVRYHLGCDTDIEGIYYELDREIQEAEAILTREANRLSPGSSWLQVLDSLCPSPLHQKSILGLYRETVLQLGHHCLEHGLISEELLLSCPVQVAPTPSHLSAIRSASSYTMPPGHPPKGGTFWVINALAKTPPLDYQMLAAHETYPGHHLLDIHRWSLDRALRRPIEFPLFYEGWACFAEELMAHTGYFRGPADGLLLAKRRLWRAIRGRVDLDIQTGRRDLPSAAQILTPLGMSKNQALSTVRKYALNPGYQLCYTVGLRRFRHLYQKFGENNPVEFALKVLSQGEIGFDNLEHVLSRQKISKD